MDAKPTGVEKNQFAISYRLKTGLFSWDYDMMFVKADSAKEVRWNALKATREMQDEVGAKIQVLAVKEVIDGHEEVRRRLAPLFEGLRAFSKAVEAELSPAPAPLVQSAKRLPIRVSKGPLKKRTRKVVKKV